MKKAIALILVCICMLGFAGCKDAFTIVSIECGSSGGIAAIEYFYEDADNLYYFPYPISKSATVTYSNGLTESLADALRAERVTLADLDRFEIEYHAEPKE